MQVSVTTTQGLERRLEVTVPAAQLAKAVSERLKSYSRSVKLKGFRPGKVPLPVVRNQFGAQAENEALNDLVQQSFATAVREQQLRPASGPRIEPLQVAAGADVRYAAVFEVLPEVKVQSLAELKIERPVAAVTPADVDAMIESMRKQKPVYTPVERPAQATDRVHIEYEGRIDGEVFPGGQGDNLRVVLGGNSVLAELDAALHGMKSGERKSVEARFPDDYRATNVAGKQAIFDLSVQKIEAVSLPPVDEAFIRGFGMNEGGVLEFRAEVQQSMERELEQGMRSRTRQNLLDALYAANPLELPKVMVDEQVQELQLQLMRRMGVQKVERLPPPEPYIEPARKRVTLGLLIGELVRQAGIKLDRRRVDERLQTLVASYPDPESVRKQYLQSREAMQQLESAALEDQALDWALTQVQFTDRPSNFGELTGFGQNESDKAA